LFIILSLAIVRYVIIVTLALQCDDAKPNCSIRLSEYVVSMIIFECCFCA